MPHQHPHPFSPRTWTRRTVLGAAATATLGAAVSASQQPAQAGPSQLTFARDGRTSYIVLVDDQAATVTRTAAEEIARYAERVSGARFQVSSQRRPGERTITVSTQRRLRPNLGDDGFAVSTEEHDVKIIGAGPRGALHGAYWFLEMVFGVHWYTEDFEVVPERRVVAVPVAELNTTQVPRFRFRQLHYGTVFEPWIRHRLNLNGRRDMYEVEVPAEIDDWSGYWPEDRPTFLRTLVDDPDLKQDENLRFMSEGARAGATATVVRLIKERIARGEDASLGIIQWDKSTWTPDPDSQAFIDAHGGATGAAMFDFVNDVARRVRRVIPAARLETEAYQWSLTPPTGMQMESNVVITFCPIWANRGEPILSPANQSQADALHGWSKVCDNIVVWDYQSLFSTYLEPLPQWYDGFESVRQVAAIPQVQGVFIQGSWNTRGGEMAPLRTWVLSRLAWDPSQDVKQLVTDFLDGYFGAAAPHLDRYLQILWSSKNANGPLGEFSHFQSPIFNLEAARAADDQLVEAERTVGDQPDFLDHVRVARFNLDYVIMSRASEYLAEARQSGRPWDLRLTERKERMQQAVVLSRLSRISEGGGDVVRLVDELDTDPVPVDQIPAPTTVAGLPAEDWRDFQETALTIAAPWMSELAADLSASNRRAVRMNPNDSQWGIQLNLQSLPDEGDWRLYLTVRADVGDLSADTPVVESGVYPPFGVNVTLTAGELADGAYREVALPQTFSRSSEHTFYVHNLNKVPALWIDRVFAVRA